MLGVSEVVKVQKKGGGGGSRLGLVSSDGADLLAANGHHLHRIGDLVVEPSHHRHSLP